MRFARGFLAGIALVVAAQPVAAQTKQLKLTSPGSTVGVLGGSAYYVGPYQAAVLSQPGTTIDIICIDFLHTIALGQIWSANFTSVVGGNLAGTREGAGGYDTYLKAAWLASQFSVTAKNEWRYIHATIWNLTAPPAPTPFPTLNDPAVNKWINLANNNYQTFNASGWHVVTDVSQPGTQEFLTYVTPEPSTYLLLGTGLFFLGFLYRRRSRPGLIRF
jgi:hypothetical protein